MEINRFTDQQITEAVNIFLAGGPLVPEVIKNHPGHDYHKPALLRSIPHPILADGLYTQLTTGEFRMARYMKVMEYNLETWDTITRSSLAWNCMTYLSALWVRIPDNRKAEWPTLAPRIDEFFRKHFAIWIHLLYQGLFDNTWLTLPDVHQKHVNDKYDQIVNGK